MLPVTCWYTSRQHTRIIIVSSEHHNIKIKLLRQVTRTSVEALFTGLNVVQYVTYEVPNMVDTAILIITDYTECIIIMPIEHYALPCIRRLSPQYMRQSKISYPTETTRK